jgi:hypothetical protein
MNWDATEPSQGTFTYSEADAIVSFAKANGQQIRGYTLGIKPGITLFFPPDTLISLAQPASRLGTLRQLCQRDASVHLAGPRHESRHSLQRQPRDMGRDQRNLQ